VAAQKNEGNNWKEKTLSTKKSSKTTQILAKTFYKELKTNGYNRNDILAVSSEILGLVTSEIREKR
jgi:hypothetical protein